MTVRFGGKRQPLAALLIGLTAGLAVLPSASADTNWPTKPVKLVIPFSAGGASDAAGRMLANELTQRLGQTVITENMPGGGTAIAAASVARATPDGYTLLLAPTGQLTILPAVESKLQYDPVKSFLPVALVASSAYIVSVAADSKIQSFSDLVAQAKKKQLSYSSCGPASVCNVTGELLNTLAGINLMHIPFQGSSPAILSVLGGHVDVAVDTEAVQVPQVQAGKLRPLVITADRRSPVLPNVPTAAEVGLPEFTSSYWVGVVVPAGTPPAIVQKLNGAINDSVKSAKMQASLGEIGMVPLGGSPSHFSDVVASDLKKWTAIVDRTGMKNKN